MLEFPPFQLKTASLIFLQIWWKDRQRAKEEPIKSWCRSRSFNLRELVVLGSSLCSLSASSYKYSLALQFKKLRPVYQCGVSPFILTTTSKPLGRADTNHWSFGVEFTWVFDIWLFQQSEVVVCCALSCATHLNGWFGFLFPGLGSLLINTSWIKHIWLAACCFKTFITAFINKIYGPFFNTISCIS